MSARIPSYTSSEVNERQSPDALRDLDNVRFVDIPWLVDADAAAFTDLKRPEYPNPTLERLYALGMDAFRVAQEFADGTPSRLEFDGATGHLSLDATRQFVREGRLMQFRGRPHRARRRALTVASARGVAGARAEALAAAFLVARGLAIVERNFRCRRGEIDIIARDGETLVFVEVRLRSRRDFGGAAASITSGKRARIDRRGVVLPRAVAAHAAMPIRRGAARRARLRRDRVAARTSWGRE